MCLVVGWSQASSRSGIGSWGGVSRLRSSNSKMAGKSVLEDDRKGKVLQGTCGWSDSSIVKCGRFYPASVKTSEDRLLHYSRFFPCVECDSSNYAIPSPAAVEKWVKCVPAGFKFHFKAFGFFTRKVRVCLWARSFLHLCLGPAYWGLAVYAFCLGYPNGPLVLPQGWC